MSKISAVLGMVLAAVPFVPAHAADCSLDAVNVFRVAKANGYTFNVISSDAKHCEFINSTLTVTAAAGHAGTCNFKLLGGQKLSTPWLLNGYVVSGDNFMLSSIPGEPPSARALRVTAPMGTTVNVSIARVRLRGGTCDNAMDAFQTDD